ncbi:SPFH domain-containing protein [Rivibacter subsaxonicus]|uniref:SPFH domain/Band 7 family protein n=1 Tax=Rivibacter subsaxonicus TaxID=457575 RepID=A0A4Q7W1M7_9BURK|nr:SPFH domain-containing protein [Rivibacter subsaxonicus]RZU03147.1 SPFH domain/Band 7 family protein [Rivibacter subsaxonicus]
MIAPARVRMERVLKSADGYLMVAVALGLVLGAAWTVFMLANDRLPPAWATLAIALAAGAVLVLIGLYMLQPNEAAILTLFGRYQGTDRSEGLRWANPLYLKRRISLRSRNLNAPTLKVNDKRGNPVEISAAVVWRVRDTAQAVFEIDDYELYVKIQAEAALRHLASMYAYDEGDDVDSAEITLRSGLEEVSIALRTELQARFAAAGVEVQDAKLTHLAYAPEIAQVMLRRQQAEAIISARAKIVHGAVSMVGAALKGLSDNGIVTLDDERKAAMVSNLLVVLCSDKDAQPIVNAGTLYS